MILIESRRLVLHAVVLPPATLDVLDSLERSGLRRNLPPTNALAHRRGSPEHAR